MKNKKNKGGRPAKYTKAEAMQKLIDVYFSTCDKRERPYTVAGLARALDMSREGLNEYRGKPEFSDTIKKAKARIEEFLECRLLSNGCVTGVIFNLKNNFGWEDKSEHNLIGDIVINLKRSNG